ncbi:MAG: hypothetical protein H0U57_07260 [Tatlockia sp.]|nr:hypothetical protein [Tatlockia sp.]
MSFLNRIIMICWVSWMTINPLQASSAHNFYRNFWWPSYHGARLNYCSADPKACGLAVATRYCRMMGYQRADQQLIDYSVGLTHLIDSPSTCNGWRCNGFKTIRCVGNLTHKPAEPYHFRYREFVYPRYEHCRVAWCYDGKKGCGRRAAFSFCRRMGFLNTRRFAIDKSVAATKAIANQKLCFGNHCNAFKLIVCSR